MRSDSGVTVMLGVVEARTISRERKTEMRTLAARLCEARTRQAVLIRPT